MKEQEKTCANCAYYVPTGKEEGLPGWFYTIGDCTNSKPELGTLAGSRNLAEFLKCYQFKKRGTNKRNSAA